MKKIILVFAACSLFLSPLFAGNNFSYARKYQPVIITGAEISDLLGEKNNEIFGFVYIAAENRWQQIPLQVDERVQFNTSVKSKHPASDLLYVSEVPGKYGNATMSDDDPAFDANDEIVFMLEDGGDKAPHPDESWAPGTEMRRVEVKVTDPLDPAAEAYVYIYLSKTLNYTAGQEVSYSIVAPEAEQATDIESDYYFVRYSRRWVLDEIRPKAALGGDNTDLIDQVKYRAYSLLPQNETEEIWSDGPGQCFMYDAGCSHYVGHKVGPVRAIRQVQGAASGPTTSYFSVFYRKMMTMQVNYRVHALPNLWFYMDYSKNLNDIKYYDEHNSGIKLDGQPESLQGASPSTWSQVSSGKGSLVLWVDVRQFAALSGCTVSPYYLDNSSFSDMTGEDNNAIGNHGVHIEEIPDTDQTDAVISYIRLFMLPPNAAQQGKAFDYANWSPVAISTLKQVTTVTPGTAVSENELEILDSFRLFPAYPNPFSHRAGGGSQATMIQFNVPRPTAVQVHVYDIQGRRVRTLFHGISEAGLRKFQWNGRDQMNQPLASGVYYIEVRTANQHQMMPVTLIK